MVPKSLDVDWQELPEQDCKPMTTATSCEPVGKYCEVDENETQLSEARLEGKARNAGAYGAVELDDEILSSGDSLSSVWQANLNALRKGGGGKEGKWKQEFNHDKGLGWDMKMRVKLWLRTETTKHCMLYTQAESTVEDTQSPPIRIKST